MHAFHISPQQQQQRTHPQQQYADNPFSNPRLLQAVPARHTSPYALARGTTDAYTRTIAHAERAAESDGSSGEVDALAALLHGGEQLTFGTRTHTHTQSGSQSGSAAASPSHTSTSAHHTPTALHARFDALANGGGSSNPNPSSQAALEQTYYDLLKLSREGDVSGVRRLLSAHSQGPTSLDFSFSDRDGDSALHRACAGGHLAMVQLLVLEGGANIHQTNHAGDTPLLVNVQSQHPQPQLVRFLIECGSDVHTKNKHGASVASLVAAASAAPTHTQTSSMGSFGFGSSSPQLAAPSSSGLSAVLSELQPMLHAAQSNPVRQFVLSRERTLANVRSDLEAVQARVAALEQAHQAQLAHTAALEAQLRASNDALSVCSTHLRDMDGELGRVQQQQHHADPQTQPQVLISEVRRALQSIQGSIARA